MNLNLSRYRPEQGQQVFCENNFFQPKPAFVTPPPFLKMILLFINSLLMFKSLISAKWNDLEMNCLFWTFFANYLLILILSLWFMFWKLLLQSTFYCKGAHSGAALRSRVGAKGCCRQFFENPTTQLRVVWELTEKTCEQTLKFACFSVRRRPLHLSQAEMLPSHAVLKEGIKWRRPPPNRKWRRA